MKTSQLSLTGLFGVFPLFCIILAEMGKLIFFRHLPDSTNPTFYIPLWTGIQTFSAPLIGLMSDLFSRKKILIISIMSMILAIIFLMLNYTLLAILTYCCSALTVVGRATYLDIHLENYHTNYHVETREVNIVNTFIAQSIPWMFIPQFLYIDFYSILVPIGTCFFGSFLVYFSKKFTDKRDNDERKLHFPLHEVFKERGKYTALVVVCTFYVLNTFWNMVQYYIEGQQNSNIGIDLKIIGWSFVIGVLIARFIVIWLDRKIENVLGSLFGIVGGYLLLTLFTHGPTNVDIVQIVFPNFTLLGGIILPLVYTFFCGKRINLHSIGTICGLLESVQYLTELSGSYSINNFNIFKESTVLISLASIFILISCGVYIFIILSKKDQLM